MAKNKQSSADVQDRKEFDQYGEQKKVILEYAIAVLKADADAMGQITRLLKLAVDEVARDPQGAFSANAQAIVNALSTTKGVTEGGDIVGAGVIDDIISLIKELIDILANEKPFFMQIIRLIFCGCNDPCGCPDKLGPGNKA